MDWYDGYDWLGPERVLNPYSMLHFFQQKSFADYWFQSGRPSHLTTLIRERPGEFIRPKLDGYLFSQIGKVELGWLEAGPILFHSGYLTIDGVKMVRRVENGKTTKNVFYSFRLPNAEVEHCYDDYGLKSVFGFVSEDFGNLASKVREAIRPGMPSDWRPYSRTC
ncbi:MAG: hypothetical protein LBL95_01030 [Deltaproteobacteria bacterium]|jgi:hypothetical protein|nr:hypothetical protein [Deltaproteobacteria bacterium]